VTGDASVVVVSGDSDADSLNVAFGDVTADYVLLLDGGVQLRDGALELIRHALARFDRTDLLYGDTASSSGEIIRRPGFSPLRLRTQDYLGGLKVFRTSMVRTLGAVAPSTNGAQSYDLSLRFLANAAEVLHVPEVLSVTPQNSRALQHTEAHIRASERHLQSIGVGAIRDGALGRKGRYHYPLAGRPKVSLIIPTRGTAALVAGRKRTLVTSAVEGILRRSTYENLEVIVVADDDTPQRVIDELISIAGDRLKLVRWSQPFNFSAKINRGAVAASGDFYIPLNDDVELITEDWIEIMLGLAQQEGVGMVGATLYFEDGTIQHAGHLYRGGAAGHVALGRDANWRDPLESLEVDREVSGVTAACAMLSADTFDRVGGFSTLLPGNYNDADLSMKIRSAGLRIVCSPFVKLYHFESKTRVARVATSELTTLRARWRSRMLADAYWPDDF
jgi:GT2 family glycosyltransferase